MGDEILKAAVRIVYERRHGAKSVAEIARRAHMTRQKVYRTLPIANELERKAFGENACLVV